MDGREIWNKFLDNIKNEIANVSFEIWFNEEDTKFYSYKDNVMTITVNQEFIRKHIEEHYMDIMTEAINRVTDSNVSFNILLEDEVKELEKEKMKQSFSLNDITSNIEKQSASNANLNPNYTFETFIVGKSNKFAYKAARVIAEAPGSYNQIGRAHV